MTAIMKRLALPLLAATALLLPLLGKAQSDSHYPTKPVRLIIGYAPGGSADSLARLIANRLSVQMGQTFVVDNRPGAASSIGANAVAKSNPDGYTIFLGSNANTINVTLYKKLPFDLQKDLAPIGLVASFPNIMVVSPSLPVKSVSDFIAYAKAHPNAVNYGSSGLGSSTFIAGEMFRSMAGIEMQHVQYKGSAPALTDLMAGQVQVMFDNAPSVLPFVQSGKLRALAVTSPQPQGFLPGVPTMTSSGLPGYEISSWYGLFAPAATPSAIVAALNKELNIALQDKSLREKLAALGATPEGGTAEAFKAHVSKEIPKWATLIRNSGASAE